MVADLNRNYHYGFASRKGKELFGKRYFKCLPARPLPAVDEDPGGLPLGEGGVDPVRGLEKVLLYLLPSCVINLKPGIFPQ